MFSALQQRDSNTFLKKDVSGQGIAGQVSSIDRHLPVRGLPKNRRDLQKSVCSNNFAGFHISLLCL